MCDGTFHLKGLRNDQKDRLTERQNDEGQGKSSKAPSRIFFLFFFFFFFQSGAIIRKYFKISPADFFPRNDIIIPEMVIVQKRK